MYLMKILLILLISVCLPFNALGDDLAVYLPRGGTTPYAGVLVPTEALQSLRKEVLNGEYDRKSLEKSLSIYQQSEDLLNKKVSVLSEQNNKLAEQLYSAKDMSTLERMFYFGLGSLLVGGISYGIYQAGIAR